MILLGCAFTWALGSRLTLLSALLTLVGLGLVTTPFLRPTKDWIVDRLDYQQRADEFDKSMPTLAKENVDRSAGMVVPLEKGFDGKWYPPLKTLDVPDVGEMTFPVNMASVRIAAELRRDHPLTPSWYLKALDAGMDAESINKVSNPGWHSNAGIEDAAKENAFQIIVGLALSLSFMAVLIIDVQWSMTRPIKVNES